MGIDCESRGKAGQSREKGGNWDNCNPIAIKYLIKNKDGKLSVTHFE